MALIEGIPVILYERTQTGEDAFHAPVYTETPVTVENVLITPVDNAAVVTDLQLTGRRVAYELCIPKGDAHRWEGCTVEFLARMASVRRCLPVHRGACAPRLEQESAGGTD